MDSLETVVSDGAVEQPFREFDLLSSTDREAGVKLMKLPSGECADLPVRWNCQNLVSQCNVQFSYRGVVGPNDVSLLFIIVWTVPEISARTRTCA